MSLNPIAASPLNPASEPGVPALAPRQALPPRRILVVEDDAAIRHIYCKFLVRSGYQVDSAEDGEAGWQALAAASHDADGYALLITDNRMPRLSGVELIQKLRSACMTLPVILASGTPPDRTESLQLAALLLKPFATDELLHAVAAALAPVIAGSYRCDTNKVLAGPPAAAETVGVEFIHPPHSARQMQSAHQR